MHPNIQMFLLQNLNNIVIMGENADAIIRNIRIRIMRLSFLGICIRIM
jgi:hypothetical protein